LTSENEFIVKFTQNILILDPEILPEKLMLETVLFDDFSKSEGVYGDSEYNDHVLAFKWWFIK
jgi:hypothetical protein